MSTCTTVGHKPKRKHLNKPDAIKHAMIHQKTTLVRVDVYRCHHCKYWHVGRHKATKKESRWLRRNEKVDERLVGQLIEALKQTLPKKMQQ